MKLMVEIDLILKVFTFIITIFFYKHHNNILTCAPLSTLINFIKIKIKMKFESIGVNWQKPKSQWVFLHFTFNYFLKANNLK